MSEIDEPEQKRVGGAASFLGQEIWSRDAFWTGYGFEHVMLGSGSEAMYLIRSIDAEYNEVPLSTTTRYMSPRRLQSRPSPVPTASQPAGSVQVSSFSSIYFPSPSFSPSPSLLRKRKFPNHSIKSSQPHRWTRYHPM